MMKGRRRMNERNIAETILEDETVLDETILEGYTGSAETVLDTLEDNDLQTKIYEPGQTIASNYIVIDCLGKGGTQATVYVARREGKQCAIKMYNRGYKPSEEFVKALKNHNCPYVAKLYDYGYENDNYYEVYEYYGNGTLEDKGKCTLSFIKDVVIPNMNEGLHFLHTIEGRGIVHGDIKPSNIFISNDEREVLIGDFGISSYLNSHGKLIDEIKGTPEYAPRTVSFFGKTTKTPAYDYGSFGLILIKLITGHSLFEGLNMTEITQMWDEGIKLPESIDSRLKRLIMGLIVEDEQRRFGYEEVKKWCEGEFVKLIDNTLYTEDDFETSNDPDPLIFGIFDDRIVTVASLRELSTAIIDNWEHTKKLMKRTTFYDFVAQFGKDIEKDIREYSKMQDEDAAVFYILYRLSKHKNIIYKGVNYGTAKEFINNLQNGADENKLKIIHQNLLEFYLKRNGYDEILISQIHRIIAMDNDNPMFVPMMLYYNFNHEKYYEMNGIKISSVDELVEEIVKMDISDIEKMAHDNKLLAWLYSIGYQEDILKFFEL